MKSMITPDGIARKLRNHGSESLNYAERVFIVEVFRAAAVSSRPEIHEVKTMIQKAHLEYCWRMTKT